MAENENTEDSVNDHDKEEVQEKAVVEREGHESNETEKKTDEESLKTEKGSSKEDHANTKPEAKGTNGAPNGSHDSDGNTEPDSSQTVQDGQLFEKDQDGTVTSAQHANDNTEEVAADNDGVDIGTGDKQESALNQINSEKEEHVEQGQSQTMSSEQPAAGVEGEQKVADNKPEDIPSATEEDKESHSDGDKPTENDPEMQKDRDSEKPEETEVKQDEVAETDKTEDTVESSHPEQTEDQTPENAGTSEDNKVDTDVDQSQKDDNEADGPSQKEEANNEAEQQTEQNDKSDNEAVQPEEENNKDGAEGAPESEPGKNDDKDVAEQEEPGKTTDTETEQKQNPEPTVESDSEKKDDESTAENDKSSEDTEQANDQVISDPTGVYTEVESVEPPSEKESTPEFTNGEDTSTTEASKHEAEERETISGEASEINELTETVPETIGEEEPSAGVTTDLSTTEEKPATASEDIVSQSEPIVPGEGTSLQENSNSGSNEIQEILENRPLPEPTAEHANDRLDLENKQLKQEIEELRKKEEIEKEKYSQLENELKLLKSQLESHELKRKGSKISTDGKTLAMNMQTEFLTRKLQDGLESEGYVRQQLSDKERDLDASERKVKDLQLRLKRFAKDDQAKDERIAEMEKEFKDLSEKLQSMEEMVNKQRSEQNNSAPGRTANGNAQHSNGNVQRNSRTCVLL